MAKLFEQIRIKSINFRNRIMVSPMCQYSSVDGFADDWHLVHLGTRAVGGAALVMTEATAVTPEGRISPDDLGIWKDEHIAFLKRITSFIEAQGAVAGIQLAHAGRKGSVSSPWKGNNPVPAALGGWQPQGPSAVPFKETDPEPAALRREEITSVIDAFRDAAVRAHKAGFKVIELHGAHGYLINEFLSPASNFRTDDYGGSFDNRIRFLLEIVEAVKTVWPQDYPLFVRLSVSDWSEKGWTPDDSAALSLILYTRGIDLVDCSSGGNVYRAHIPVGPLYQVPLAEKVKQGSEVLTGAVGLITTPRQCEQILAEGKADMIVLARQLLRDPYFPLHAAKELGVDVGWPQQYERAKM